MIRTLKGDLNIMKKFIAILAIVSLGVLLAGCGKKEETIEKKMDKGISAAGKAAKQAKTDAANAADDLGK